MKKRGQLQSELFKHILIVFMVVIIFLFGLNSINKVRTASCKAELPLFENNLKGSIEEMYGELGSVKEKSFNVPLDGEALFYDYLGNDRSPVRKFICNDYKKLHSLVFTDGTKYSIEDINQTRLPLEIPVSEIRQELSRIKKERRQKRQSILELAREEKLTEKKLYVSSENLLDPDVLEQLKALGYIK